MTILNAYQKSFDIKTVAGIDITAEMLAKINKFSIKTLTKDDVYVRKYIMAHNGIDRDRERFPEPLLDDFAGTLAGKSLLEVHNRQSLPIGLYFDSYTEEITPEKFMELTGEKIRLPEHIRTAKILWGFIYMLKVAFNEKIISNIEAGIYRHASIGFRASDLTPIKGEFDQVLYWEYVPPGEALEGSIVWLGAQPGATAQKAVMDTAKEMIEQYIEKGVVTYAPTTPADIDTAWDAAAARRRLAVWASSDGSGDKDKMDWAKYRRGFAWFDSENTENFGSYKLPHHDVRDGSLVVIWNGVSAAMAALLGARGGVDIPSGDVDRVYSHLSRHYAQFDKEPPEKTFTEGGNKKMEELRKLLEKMSKALKAHLTEENVIDEIKSMIDIAGTDAKGQIAEKDKAIGEKDAKIKELTDKVNELTPLAADGKAYRKEMVDNYVTMKAKLGDVSEEKEAQDKVRAVADGYPIDFLKAEVNVLNKRVEEKFPAEGQLKGDDGKNRQDGKKENPLIPKDE